MSGPFILQQDHHQFEESKGIEDTQIEPNLAQLRADLRKFQEAVTSLRNQVSVKDGMPSSAALTFNQDQS